MVSVTPDHSLQILNMPRIKQLVIIIPFLWRFPYIKCFVLNQKSHFIAEIEKLRCRGIMAGSDGIASHLLQDFKLTLEGTCIYCSPQCTKIMMVANSLHLNFFTIKKKSIAWSESQSSETHIGFTYIRNGSSLGYG
jgi:hypothetical protein